MAKSPATQSNKEEDDRKTGRRYTIMILFALNVIFVPLAITPLVDVVKWVFDFEPDVMLMFHGMFLLLWMALNGVGVWAAHMGD